MEIFARIIELKPGSADRVDAWTKLINAHQSAAVEALEAEGGSVESWFSLSLNGKDVSAAESPCCHQPPYLMRSGSSASKSSRHVALGMWVKTRMRY